jgi:hypothetical protein
VELLRITFLIFIKAVVILEAAVSQVAADRFCGEPILFCETALELADQSKKASDLSGWFNELAVGVAVEPIDPDKLREELQPEIDQQTSGWIRLARMESLNLFGTHQELHAAIDEGLRSFRSKDEEAPATRNRAY